MSAAIVFNSLSRLSATKFGRGWVLGNYVVRLAEKTSYILIDLELDATLPVPFVRNDLSEVKERIEDPPQRLGQEPAVDD